MDREDIKRVALGQLAEGGAAAVSVNAIGRSLGVSGPAVYRHFSGRPELLTALALDAYAELDAHVARHTSSVAAFAAAYREWALAHPRRYGLLFDDPAPGYDNQAQELVDAGQRLMDRLLDVLRTEGVSPPPPSTAALRGEIARWLRARDNDADPALALRALELWVELHGFVGLELGGNLASMGIDGGRLMRELVSRRG